MNWPETQLAVLDAATGAVEFAVNWLLQSTLLITAGFTIGRILRQRGSAVQSVVFRTTMVALLVCPLATWGLSLAGVSGWSVKMTRAWSQHDVDSRISKVDSPDPFAASELAEPIGSPVPTTDLAPLYGEEILGEERITGNIASDQRSSLELNETPIIEVPSIIAGSATEAPLESVPAGISIQRFGMVSVAAVAIWLCVSFVLTLRLATAWGRLSRLRRQAVQADADTIEICHEFASELNVSAPDVRRSPCLPSPCLAGIFRPAVLLPEVCHTLSIREVLIHELAHLRRWDCHWNLLRQIATAVFFFQPLLWKLSRLLESTAEEVCDDYVVEFGGDRREYAHGLVDIAELSSAPIAAAGVGIASFRSMLARRVSRIMDTSRTLSTRAGNLLLVTVLAGGVIGTTIAGLVGLGPRPTQAEAATATNDGEDISSDEDNEQDANDDDQITIEGKVVDPDGNPFAGASIQITRWYWDPDIPKVPLATATSGAHGQFKISYRKSQFNVDVQRPDMWKEVTIVASVTNYGPAWVSRTDLEPNEKPTLQLVRDDVPITGRIIDLEGNPLPGVTVKVGRLATSVDENLDAWLDALRRGEILWEASNRYLGKYAPHNPESCPETVLTDADGCFELKGVGRERRIGISVVGPTIAYSEATIVTRKMKPMVANDGMPDPEWSRKHTVYGADCQIAVHPTQPILGTIRDAETGKPLSGVTIESYRMTERGISAGRLIRVASDEAGRFELVGMPKGPGKQIIAVPNDGQAYLMRKFDVPDQPGLAPIEMDLKLHRGVWITGRVTEKETKKPIPARVHYLPYRTNSFAEALPEFDDDGNVDGYQQRYVTDDRGVFQVVGLPGRAIVGVECVSKVFPRGMGHKAIEGLDKHGHFQTYRNPVSPGKLWPSAMKEIDVSPDEEEVKLDFELDPGRSVTMTAVDQDGRKLAGLNVAGVRNREHWQPVDSATIDVFALAPGEERTLLLHQVEQRLGKALQFVACDDAPQELTVQLEPCAIVRGRLVDDNEQPITGARIRISPRPGGDYSPELKSTATDAEGRFEHDGILPGAAYAVMSESTQVGFKTLAKDLIVSPGETIDLGTIDVTVDERPEPVRRRRAKTTSVDASGNSGEEGTVAAAQDIISREYEGKVVDPRGKPVENAKLYLVFHIPQPTGLLRPTWKPLATTDAAGAFRFTARPTDFGIHTTREVGYGALVAVKEGFGFAWSQAGMYEKSGTWLREARARLKEAPAEFLQQMQRMLSGTGGPLKLVADDEPIRGRIVDINGQPVKGARLTLLEVWSGVGDDLTAWRKATAEPKADYYSARMKTPMSINGPQVRSLVQPAVTDSGGRFTLRGVGSGRIAELLMEGPGIESAKIFARTETGKQIELLRERRSPDLGSYTYYPAELTCVAGPSVAITGVVRDAETQTPLSSVTVKSQSRHGEPISGWGQDFVRAVTDREGRYRLEGMPIGSDNRIAAIAPMGDVAYFSMSKRASTNSQDRPLEVDFALTSGVWIEGRIIDKQTGRGLTGRLAYFVKKESPNYKFARSLSVDQRDRLLSDDDGRFRIAALPGPGFVTFMAHEHQDYPRAEVILKVDGRRENVGRTMLETGPSLLVPQNYHLVAEVNPLPDAESMELNLQLDRGTSLFGRAIGPDDQPLTGYDYVGQMAQFDTWRTATGDRFELKGYDPDSPRHVYFALRKRNLAGHVIVKGELSEELVVKLQPAGEVKGRLVDDDGAPLANCQLLRWSPPIRSPADSGGKYRAPPLPRNRANSQTGQYETDEEGRFRISHLVPGVKYRIRAIDRASMTGAQGRAPKFSGPLDVVIQVEPGESKDLGDVRLGDDAESNAAANKTDEEPPAVMTKQQNTVTGRITLASGEPAAGAHVAVIARRVQALRGGNLSPNGEVLAEGRADDNGNYRLTLERVSSKTHRYANVIARKNGMAVAWKQLNLDEIRVEAPLELPPEELIKGKLVDIEGQPAAGVELSIQSVMRRSNGGVQSGDGVGFRSTQTSAAWLEPVSTDKQGRFTVSGVPTGHGLFLNVVGSDRFAPQGIALNTGMPEQRGERDGTYRPLVRNATVGEEVVLPLAPAQLFEGRVTYEDTGQPAPSARLTIWASQQEPVGSMIAVGGIADAEGRYRISPKPGIRFGVTAYPPEGVPYLARRTPLEKAIRWQQGDTSRQVNVLLPRGILVKGKVVEMGSNAAVADATIQYIPERANNPNTADDILTGWQGIQLSNEKGEFEIAVLPGPGRLLLHGPHGKYVLQEFASRQLSHGQPGGQRVYAHAVHEINPDSDTERIDVAISLQPGATVVGRIVDEKEEPVDEALVITRLVLSRYSITWRGQMPPTLGGRFELDGLKKGNEYPVHFLDAKRRLGATVNLRASSGATTVVLKPCGEAQARFVDPEGQPNVGFRPGLRLVVTPGEHEHDYDAAKRGELLADADFVSNIDRTNYWPGPETDDQGNVTFPALIPGATYRLSAFEDGKPKLLKQFTVESGEQLKLRDIVIDLND